MAKLTVIEEPVVPVVPKKKYVLELDEDEAVILLALIGNHTSSILSTVFEALDETDLRTWGSGRIFGENILTRPRSIPSRSLPWANKSLADYIRAGRTD